MNEWIDNFKKYHEVDTWWDLKYREFHIFLEIILKNQLAGASLVAQW